MNENKIQTPKNYSYCLLHIFTWFVHRASCIHFLRCYSLTFLYIFFVRLLLARFLDFRFVVGVSIMRKLPELALVWYLVSVWCAITCWLVLYFFWFILNFRWKTMGFMGFDWIEKKNKEITTPRTTQNYRKTRNAKN